MARMTLAMTAAVVTSIGVAGCPLDEDPVAGPCIHDFVEPILTIQSATSRDGQGTPIPELWLSDFTVDGNPHQLNWLHPRSNAEVVEGRLHCQVPCGFGSQPGVWRFLAEAQDHQSQTFETTAEYAVFVGGCPSYNDEGTDVGIELDPA